MFRNSVVFIVAAFFVSACSVGKVVPLDAKTGYYPASTKAKVVTSKAIDLDSKKTLLLIPNDEFVKGQLANLKYFDEIIKLRELETKVIQANLTEKIPSVNDRIGISNAAKFYKPFLWFRYERQNLSGETPVARFALTDPTTMEDYFVTETELDYAWKGVNDQFNWYPMFNAFIDYVKANSKTYSQGVNVDSKAN